MRHPSSLSLSQHLRRFPGSIDASHGRLTATACDMTEIDVHPRLLQVLVSAGPPRLRAAAEAQLSAVESQRPWWMMPDDEANHHHDRDTSADLTTTTLSSLSTLHTVLLSRNAITSLIGCVQFRHVVRLSLLGNRIRRLEDCDALALLPHLAYLSLEFCPVARLPHFRPHILQLCAWPDPLTPTNCRLKKLDTETVTPSMIRHALRCLAAEDGPLLAMGSRWQLVAALEAAEQRLRVHEEMRQRHVLLPAAARSSTAVRLADYLHVVCAAAHQASGAELDLHAARLVWRRHVAAQRRRSSTPAVLPAIGHTLSGVAETSILISDNNNSVESSVVTQMEDDDDSEQPRCRHLKGVVQRVMQELDLRVCADVLRISQCMNTTPGPGVVDDLLLTWAAMKSGNARVVDGATTNLTGSRQLILHPQLHVGPPVPTPPMTRRSSTTPEAVKLLEVAHVAPSIGSISTIATDTEDMGCTPSKEQEEGSEASRDEEEDASPAPREWLPTACCSVLPSPSSSEDEVGADEDGPLTLSPPSTRPSTATNSPRTTTTTAPSSPTNTSAMMRRALHRWRHQLQFRQQQRLAVEHCCTLAEKHLHEGRWSSCVGGALVDLRYVSRKRLFFERWRAAAEERWTVHQAKLRFAFASWRRRLADATAARLLVQIREESLKERCFRLWVDRATKAVMHRLAHERQRAAQVKSQSDGLPSMRESAPTCNNSRARASCLLSYTSSFSSSSPTNVAGHGVCRRADPTTRLERCLLGSTSVVRINPSASSRSSVAPKLVRDAQRHDDERPLSPPSWRTASSIYPLPLKPLHGAIVWRTSAAHPPSAASPTDTTSTPHEAEPVTKSSSPSWSSPYPAADVEALVDHAAALQEHRTSLQHELASFKVLLHEQKEQHQRVRQEMEMTSEKLQRCSTQLHVAERRTEEVADEVRRLRSEAVDLRNDRRDLMEMLYGGASTLTVVP